jgi:Fe-S oxidoreductase
MRSVERRDDRRVPDRGVSSRLGADAQRAGAPQALPPGFARRAFTAEQRVGRDLDDADVVLWPDPYTDLHRPQALHAAYRTLRWMGLRVAAPPGSALSAEPLHTEGRRDARRQMRNLLRVLQPMIARRLPLVALEPAFIARLRDRTLEQLADDVRARHLADSAHTFAEFLLERGFQPPPLANEAVVHMFRRQRAAIDADAAIELLDAMLAGYAMPDSGCCDIAGSGSDRGRDDDPSKRTANLALVHALRAAKPDALLIADGSRCREHIRQATGREAIHTAEAVWDAIQSRASLRCRETRLSESARAEAAAPACGRSVDAMPPPRAR